MDLGVQVFFEYLRTDERNKMDSLWRFPLLSFTQGNTWLFSQREEGNPESEGALHLEILKLAQKSWIGQADSFPLVYHAQTGTLLSRSPPSCWFCFVAFHWSGHLSIWFCIQHIHNPKSWPFRVTMDVNGQWHGYPTHSHFKKKGFNMTKLTSSLQKPVCIWGEVPLWSPLKLVGSSSLRQRASQEDFLWRTGRLKEHPHIILKREEVSSLSTWFPEAICLRKIFNQLTRAVVGLGMCHDPSVNHTHQSVSSSGILALNLWFVHCFFRC